MKTIQQILFSVVMVTVVGCIALALLGSCSGRKDSSDTTRQSEIDTSTPIYATTNSELATEEEWTRLQNKINEASAYTDSSPYTEESWWLLEQAKRMANRAMMGYPDTHRSSVRAAAQQLESSLLTLTLR